MLRSADMCVGRGMLAESLECGLGDPLSGHGMLEALAAECEQGMVLEYVRMEGLWPAKKCEVDITLSNKHIQGLLQAWG